MIFARGVEKRNEKKKKHARGGGKLFRACIYFLPLNREETPGYIRKKFRARCTAIIARVLVGSFRFN